MPAYRYRAVLEVARGIKAFLALELGISRGGGALSGSSGAQARELEVMRKRFAEKECELAGLRSRLAESDVRSEIRPANMIWIFGTGRSGSTWLRSMMAELSHHRVWEEPMVGKLFGGFYSNAQAGQLKSANFVMGNPNRRNWTRSIRNFVLETAGYAHPELRVNDYLVVKEPNGTEGATLIMEALPESRMIFLIRDPRDVAASSLDAARKDSWLYERKSKGQWKENAIADRSPDVFVQRRAEKYLQYISRAKEAYEAHGGCKVLVRYEDLRSDTLGAMRRIYTELGIEVDEKELERAVEKHAWENISEDKKGEGKFYRKASPGGWREDLTPRQVEIVEKVTAPILNEFYPA